MTTRTQMWILVAWLAGAAMARSAVQPLDFTLNATPAAAVDLGGQWQLAKDEANEGKKAEWFLRGPIRGSVAAGVPNPLELTFPGYDGVVSYWRSFDAGDLPRYDDVRIYFQGADYFAEAWLNGRYLGGNESALLPFAFAAKQALRPGKNELAVRVVDASYAREVDGFQLGHVPGGRQADDPLQSGWRHHNYGGLLLPVSVQAFRRPWVADGFIRPDVRGSRINVDLRLVGAKAGEWRAVIRPVYPTSGSPVAEKTIRIAPDAGGRSSIAIDVPNPHLWQVWNSFLYQIELSPGGGRGAGTVWRERFGMREISILNGRLAVNGKQILQRSYLYNQIWPVTLGVPYEDLARRDIELVRRTNANMLRCFSKTPVPETVKAADEVGILLQPESLASWYLERGEKEQARLKNISERNVLLYRNHPSIVWWNILNENSPNEDSKNKMLLGPFALREILPSLHALDPTRPVIANDPIWSEVPNIWEAGRPTPTLPLQQDHYYQFTGLENHEDSWLKYRGRAWGEKPRPDAPFLGITEWGQNSSPDWDRLFASYKSSGLREDAQDYVVYRKLREMNLHWYEKSGIRARGFPTFESLQAANREAVAERYREHFALFWGNVHCVGQGLTSLEDSTYEFSGIVDTWRHPKPLVFDTITELNRPLQINLWLRPASIYQGDSFSFDATLVNEGQRLPAGSYTLDLKLIDARNQVVLKKEYPRKIQGDMIEFLLTESLVASVQPGAYELQLSIETQDYKLKAARPVQVFSREPRRLTLGSAPWVWETGDGLKKWLQKRGVAVREGDAGQVRAGDIMLINEFEGGPEEVARMQAAVRRGARAIVLRPEQLFSGKSAPAGADTVPGFSSLLEPVRAGWKPELREIGWWGEPGAWGYGRTALALQHPFLEGLPQGIALEARPPYQRIAPRFTFLLTGQPDDLAIDRAVVEASVHVNIPYTADLFSLSLGEGTLVLTTLRIADFLDGDPAADRILENILQTFGARRN